MELENQKINNEFIGKDELINSIIKKLNSKKLQNSIILYGSKGIGKATLVFSIVKKIFNVNQNKLPSEILHQNFYYITPIFDEKKLQHKEIISVDQIRELNKNIQLTNLNDLPKIILIDSVDLLNKNASNALLKILEEPPQNVYFFLISHQLSSLLATIKSRCIKFKIDNPDLESFKKILLLKNIDINDEELNDLFYLTYSSPGNAISFVNYDFINIKNEILEIILNKELLNQKLIDFTSNINKNSNFFYIYIYIVKFILINILKCQLNILEYKNLSFSNEIFEISNLIPTKKILSMLEYINNNETEVNIYNLDKKIFIINSFSKLLIN